MKTFGKGDTRVICPITDAFVAHHGALGGFVRVWCRGKATPKQIIDVVRGLEGIELRVRQGSRVQDLDLPVDREGDVVVIANADVCVGAAQADHDLSGLEGHRLRTHGGVGEAKVPFVVSEPLNDAYQLKAGNDPQKLSDFRFCDQRPGALTTDGRTRDATMPQRQARRLRRTEPAVHDTGFSAARTAANEVLVRIRMSTICRSDIHSYQGPPAKSLPGNARPRDHRQHRGNGRGYQTRHARRSTCNRRPYHLERIFLPGPTTTPKCSTCRRNARRRKYGHDLRRTIRIFSADLASTVTSCPAPGS